MTGGLDVGERSIMASEFKARCLALLDQVAETKATYVVTKRGRPVARIVPVEDAEPRPVEGSVRLIVDDDEDYFATGETWEVEGPSEP